ncbi:MAG: YdcF family protein [Anaerolineales bacterium]|nr:YdcF family protein [Anaerolineales bacterium]MDW8160445.1 YdcF family protein [Anaerolineales bacterium]
MFVFLSKVLPPLIYPLGMSTVLLLCASLLYRFPRLSRSMVWTAFLLLWLGGNRLVAYHLARALEWQYLPPESVPEVEVMVVLGGGTLAAAPPRVMPEVNGAGDRLLYAARLYHEGKAAKILLSGGAIEWYTPSSPNPAAEMASLLQWMGVPEEALILEGHSQNTLQNAQFSKAILEKMGVHRILLVTSAMHMPRSVRAFERQGFEVIPAPTDYTVTQSGWQRMTTPTLANLLLNLIPTADNLSLTTRALKEILGTTVYEWID